MARSSASAPWNVVALSDQISFGLALLEENRLRAARKLVVEIPDYFKVHCLRGKADEDRKPLSKCPYLSSSSDYPDVADRVGVRECLSTVQSSSISSVNH